MPQTDDDYEQTRGLNDQTSGSVRKSRSKGSLKKLTRQSQVEISDSKKREMLKQESKDSGIVTEMVVRPKEGTSPSQKEYTRSETSTSTHSPKSKRSFKGKQNDKIKRSQSVKETRHVKGMQAERSHDDLEIELLTPKQNGSVDDDDEKKNPSMIRGMWRKAFKTLKSSPSVEKLSKKSSFNKKKQNSKEADEEVEQLSRKPGPVDPVYSLLKCAADLPRSGGKSPCLVHAHCSGQHSAIGYARYPSGGETSSGNTSKTSSPSSSGPPPLTEKELKKELKKAKSKK